MTFPSGDDLLGRLNALHLIGFWDCDFVTGQAVVSPGMANFFGLICAEPRLEASLDEIIGNVPKSDRMWAERWRPLAVDSAGLATIEYRVRDRAGDMRWVRCRGRYEVGPRGELLTGQGLVFDITAAKREGKSMMSPRNIAQDPLEHLADLLLEAHSVAKGLGASSVTELVGPALMAAAELLAIRDARKRQDPLKH